MPKFRSMVIDTPDVETDLLVNPSFYLSSIGSFLRSTSLDELPQLFSIIRGDMCFVGPRPALYNQYELISLRKEKGVDKLLTGITGWAQVNGRDELSIPDKVALDVEYLSRPWEQQVRFRKALNWLEKNAGLKKIFNSFKLEHYDLEKTTLTKLPSKEWETLISEEGNFSISMLGKTTGRRNTPRKVKHPKIQIHFIT